MRVTVHLDPAVAKELSGGPPESAAAIEMTSVIRNLGMELRPVHPGSPDPALAATFFVEARDASHAAEAVTRLQAIGAKAYMKPPPAMP